MQTMFFHGGRRPNFFLFFRKMHISKVTPYDILVHFVSFSAKIPPKKSLNSKTVWAWGYNIE